MTFLYYFQEECKEEGNLGHFSFTFSCLGSEIVFHLFTLALNFLSLSFNWSSVVQPKRSIQYATMTMSILCFSASGRGKSPKFLIWPKRLSWFISTSSLLSHHSILSSLMIQSFQNVPCCSVFLCHLICLNSYNLGYSHLEYLYPFIKTQSWYLPGTHGTCSKSALPVLLLYLTGASIAAYVIFYHVHSNLLEHTICNHVPY